MKKVIIITYYWPPSGGAGVQRWLKFVKYLKDFGWEPIVYTAENGEMPVIDESLQKDIPANTTILKTKIWEPYNFYKKLLGKGNEKINAAFLNESGKTSKLSKFAVWIRGNFFIPDARKFWIKPSIKYLNNYIQQNKVDAIISSGPPHSMHLIALGIKSKNKNIKWIADFRDPWTNIDFYKDLMLTSFANKKHKRLEKQVLRESDAVISIGKSMSTELFEINDKIQKEKFKIIPNGYDEGDLSKKEVEKDLKFTIAHIGTLVKTRNPKVLWNVLQELVTENDSFKEQLEIKLVGKIDVFVMDNIKKHNLNAYVNKIDYLPHNLVIEEQQKSKVNLLLVNNTPNAKGILTGKFFEYLSAGSPILAIGPTDGDLAEILNETKSGFISDFNDAKSLKINLLNLFNNSQIQRNEDAIKNYSRKKLTEKLASILNELTKN